MSTGVIQEEAFPEKFVPIAYTTPVPDSSLPEFQLLFKDPIIHGALFSLLGPNYMLHPHRYIHDNPPKSGGQAWHHDTYWGYLKKVRNHHPWWLMLMYMPQETQKILGPTGILPGSQYLNKRIENPDDFEIPNSGPAGNCMIIHYDLWHHKMKNHTKSSRYMAKFEFVRRNKPSSITWSNKNSLKWKNPKTLIPYNLEPIWKNNWSWITLKPLEYQYPKIGEIAQLRKQLKSPDKDHRLIAAGKIHRFGPNSLSAIDLLEEALLDKHEPISLNASYALGSMGNMGVKALYNAIKSNDGPNETDPRLFFDEGQEWELGYVVRNAVHGLIVSGSNSLSTLIELSLNGDGLSRRYSAFAMGELEVKSKEIEEHLVNLCFDNDPFVRISAIESLGIRPSSPDSVKSICKVLENDIDDEIRSHAALALWRTGTSANIISSLELALYDGDRYVQAYALEALQRVNTTESLNVMVEHLKKSRWCSITNKKNMF